MLHTHDGMVRTCRGHCQGAQMGQCTCTYWWRWPEHSARLAERDSRRVISHILSWWDAMYHETLRALHWRRVDPTRNRLWGSIMGAPQGRWEDPVGRWEDPICKLCNMHTRVFTPWQQVAQDRHVWQELKAQFVQTLLPQRRVSEVP